MGWGTKNLDAMVLSVTAMKDILFCSTASVSDTGGYQLPLFDWVISCLSLIGYVRKMENVGSRQAQIASDENRKMFSQVI